MVALGTKIGRQAALLLQFAMDEQDLDNDAERKIDELCDHFESELQAGHRPKIDDYLLRVSLVDRPRLTLELLRLTLDYAGREPVVERNTRPTRLLRDSPSVGASSETVAERGSADTNASGAPASLSAGASEAGPRLPRVGDFELLDELGSGGMGTVYRARQVSLNRIVALKVIRPDRLPGLSTEQRRLTIERFLRESQAATRREHAHILAVYDAGCADSVYYLAMQYVDGGSLAEKVRNGPLAGHQAATFLEPVCRALHVVHQGGIIHRDLKPSNILIDQDTGYSLISDFGLAKVRHTVVHVA